MGVQLRFILLILSGFVLSNIKAQEENTYEAIQEHYYNSEFAQVISKGDSVLKKVPDSEQAFKIAIAISSSYGQIGVYDKAYEYAEKANSVALTLNDTSKIIMSAINKVGCFYYLKNYDAGIKLLNKIMQYVSADVYIPKKKDIYDSFAMFYSIADKHDSSVFYVNKLIELNKKYPDTQYAQALASYCSYVKDTNLCNAEIDTFYMHVNQLSLSKTNYISLYKMLFQYYTYSNQLQKAKLYNDSLLNIGILDAGDFHKKTYYHNLQKYYRALKDTSNAFQALLNYFEFDNKIDSMNSSNEILKSEQILEIEKIKSRTEALEMSLKRSQQKLILLSSAILLFVILLSVIAWLYNNKHKQGLALEKTAEDRSRMISILSHDLRSPLSQLSSLMDVVIHHEVEPQDQKRYFTTIQKNTQQTLSMLDNVVHWILSRNHSNEVTVEEVSLPNVYSKLKQNFSSVLANKSIMFESDFSIETIVTDANFLVIILQNLLTNAVKFSNEESKIVLGSSVNGSTQIIWLQDFGQGMNQEQIDKILTGTTFTTSIQKNEKGLGLGMEIVRSSVQQLGAQLNVLSKEGEGTTFQIIFQA